MIADLVSRINSFDFLYDYSDCGQTWRRWNNERQSIRENLLTIPASFIPVIASQLYKAAYLKTFVKL